MARCARHLEADLAAWPYALGRYAVRERTGRGGIHLAEQRILTRRQRIDWIVVASVLLVAVLGQVFELRNRPAAWPQLLPGLSMLVGIASFLAAERRPALARGLQLGSAALAGAVIFHLIEHWLG